MLSHRKRGISKSLRLKCSQVPEPDAGGKKKKSDAATPTLRTEGMEQSITKGRELKNRDGQVGIEGEKTSRRGGERATRKEGDRRREPLLPRSKRGP